MRRTKVGAGCIASFMLLSCTSHVPIRGVAAQDSEDYPDCDGTTSNIGDAICDLSLNNAECAFDGGDCCECTCIDSDTHSCGEISGFYCLDPDAPPNCGPTSSPTASPTSTPSAIPYPDCKGYLAHIRDGFCDEDLNNADCDWDGGDCCACTCADGLSHECGMYGDGYDCRDPDVPDDCDLANLALCTGYTYDHQDGYCDDDLNNAECGWDGGDCCRCTCRDFGTGYYDWYGDACGVYGYDCKDPDAPTDCDTLAPTPAPASSTPYPECEGIIYYIGDGDCDYSNNNEECDWDGGDCCDYGDCYSCYDPDAECISSDDDDYDYSSGFYSTWYSTEYSATTSDSCLGSSDGQCDSENNNEACGYDGGDCCECTCETYIYVCGTLGYSCEDPDADCYLDDDTASRDGVSTPSPASTFAAATDASDDESLLGLSEVESIVILIAVIVVACLVGSCVAAAIYVCVVRRDPGVKIEPSGQSAAGLHSLRPAPSAPSVPVPLAHQHATPAAGENKDSTAGGAR